MRPFWGGLMRFVTVQYAGLFALALCLAQQAQAQSQAPASAQAGVPSIDEAPAAPEAQAITGDAQPAPVADRKVDILNYRVEGNTTLPRIEVEKAVMPFLGPQRSVADVEAARAALEKAYRDRGFETVGVEIPDQDVRNGIVRLAVVELKVGRLRVTDARYYSPEDIKDKIPALAEGQVPNYKQVSKEMAALNRSGGKLVTPSLRAGDTPGTVDVDLQVDDTLPFHGSFELNDRASSRTDLLRASASIRYTNLFQRGHSLSLQGQLTPTDPGQSWAVSGSYVAPIADSGFSALGYFVHSRSDVAAIGGIGVIGSGDIFGLRGLYSFTTGPDTAPTVHQLVAGFDYKDFQEQLILGSDTASTPIDYVPLTLQYSIGTRTTNNDFNLSLGANVGLRGISADEQEFRTKRYNASASWAALRVELDYLARLKGGWQAGFRFASQLASGPLISNEQFSAGGLDSVRGYYESQDLGDDGISGQFQLDTPNLIPNVKGVNNLRFFTFVDAAYLRVRDPLPGQQKITGLSSVGLGLNMQLLDRINASFLLAAPLRDASTVPTNVGDSMRAQLRLWTEF